MFMDQALELPSAGLLALVPHRQCRPRSSDTAFTWEQFQSAANRDLADVLGNFVNRITKFTESKFGAACWRAVRWGRPKSSSIPIFQNCWPRLRTLLKIWKCARRRKTVRRTWALGNEYLQENAPWTAIKTDVDRAAVIVRHGLNLVRLYAALAQPIIPTAAAAIARCVGAELPLAWPSTDAKAELNHLAVLGRYRRGRGVVQEDRGYSDRRMGRALRRG